MPTLHTSRKQLSQLLTAASETFHNDDASFATVAVTGSGSAEPIGTPIVWNDTDKKWVKYAAATDIDATKTSTLPNGAVVALTVGTQEGVGRNFEDLTLTAGGVNARVVFRGAEVQNGGIEWGAINSTNQAAFVLQLQKQGVNVVQNAANATQLFV